MKVNDLVFNAHRAGCMRATVEFDNGYAASVVSGGYTYTNKNHPYEVAVLYNGYIVYDTPVTDDVVGYCTEEDVNTILQQIESLPARG